MNIWQTIAGTPWWVYAVALYIVYCGCLATRPHMVTANRLLILPTVLMLGSLIFLLTSIQLSITNIAVWTAAATFGTLFGWLHFRYLNVKATIDKKQIYIPGNWSVLIMLFAAFTLDYFYADAFILTRTTAMHPMPLLLLYGLFGGLFIGRSGYSLHCLRSGPYLPS